MFKNLKLSAKLYAGFGVLVLIAGILGFVSWNGVNSVKEQMEEYSHWADVDVTMAEHLVQSFLQVDMAIDEYIVDRDKTALQAVNTYYEGIGEGLDEWRSLPQVIESKELQNVTVKVEDANTKYKNLIDEFTVNIETTDKLKEQWDNLISECLATLMTTMEDVIDPAKEEAEIAENIAEMVKWGAIDMVMNEAVIANALKLQTASHDYAARPTDESWENLLNAQKTAHDGLSEWRETLSGEARMEIAAGTIEGYFSEYDELTQAYYQRVNELEKNMDALGAAFDAIDEYLDRTMENVIDPAKATAEDAAYSAQQQATLIALILAASGVILGIILAIFITRSITKPINSIIANLSTASEQVAAASQQVASASQSLAQGASEQASSLEETSSSLEEMASMTRQNADNAKQADGLMVETKQYVGQGNSSMEGLNVAIDEIKKSSDETAKIIKVIDEIAFQTNLLALNAAVEAARAGEAGKGFAVVAEEVRNLAMRSAEAAKDTSSLIEGSQQNADKGVSAAEETAKSITDIAGSSEKVAALVGEIAGASAEQAQGIDQLNTAVSQMDQVTQQNASNAEESSSASEEMAAQAQQMQEVVNDLSALVFGASTTTKARANKQVDVKESHQRWTEKPELKEKLHRLKEKIQHQKEEVQKEPVTVAQKTEKPEDIIPLQEGELQDF
jgi:methyl-accepting chemotaxis protein